jgi:hypothetical protein
MAVLNAFNTAKVLLFCSWTVKGRCRNPPPLGNHSPRVPNGPTPHLLALGDLVNRMLSVQAETIDNLSSYIAIAYPG